MPQLRPGVAKSINQSINIKKNIAGEGRLEVWGEKEIATLYGINRLCLINKVIFKLRSKGGGGISHLDI